jgi:hypothetical protein
LRAELFGRWAGGRVEFSNELDEHVSELWIVVLWLGADNFDHLAVAVRCLLFLAPRLVHHSEAIPSVVHVRKALKEIASGGLGLFQLTGFHEVDRGVGGGGQLFEFIIHRAVIGKPLKDRGFRRKLLGATGCGALLAVLESNAERVASEKLAAEKAAAEKAVEEKAAAEKAAAEKAAAEKAAADEAMRKAEQEIEQQKEAFKQDQSRYIGSTASGSWQCHGGWRHSKAVDDFQRCEAKQWARSRRFSIPPKHL